MTAFNIVMKFFVVIILKMSRTTQTSHLLHHPSRVPGRRAQHSKVIMITKCVWNANTWIRTRPKQIWYFYPFCELFFQKGTISSTNTHLLYLMYWNLQARLAWSLILWWLSNWQYREVYIPFRSHTLRTSWVRAISVFVKLNHNSYKYWDGNDVHVCSLSLGSCF